MIELKGKTTPSDSDIDQAAAYGRDLRNYHAACEGRLVEVLLVPTRARGVVDSPRGIRVVGPDQVDAEICRIAAATDVDCPEIDPAAFLSEEAYRPLPTIVQAARELFFTNDLRRVHRRTPPPNRPWSTSSKWFEAQSRTRGGPWSYWPEPLDQGRPWSDCGRCMRSTWTICRRMWLARRLPHRRYFSQATAH